jgi:hypothetical protein
MRRRLFNLAAAVSLVLCAATVALWARSHVAGDSFERNSDTALGASTNWFVQDRGRLIWSRSFWPRQRGNIYATWTSLTPEGPIWEHHRDRDAATSIIDHGSFGFHIQFGTDFAGSNQWHEVMVPNWFVAMCFAIVPLIAVELWRRRRLKSGLCVRCGYDLRATPERCPECGTGVATANPALRA